jgi:Uma2 family endonuclease
VVAGILEEDARVELIEGDLIDMAPIGSLHAGMVARLGRILTLATVGQALVYAQSPIVCGEHSEPQPDIALLRPRADDYTEALPVPSDVLLLIEVADRSLRYDREIKVPLYARHRIAEVWLIDLPQRRIEVCREPGIDGYRHLLRPIRATTSPYPRYLT